MAPAKGSTRSGKEKGESTKKAKGKRPLSAFFIFSQAMRPEIMKKHPDFKVSDVAKELGQLWRNMDEKAKKKYQDDAEARKAAYNKQ